MELSEAPTGYHSVHGVKSSNEVSSDFKGDEYAIYSTSQQRIRYNNPDVTCTYMHIYVCTEIRMYCVCMHV